MFNFLSLFSTREIAIALWLVISIIFALIYKPTRKAVVDIIKTACSIQLVLPFICMLLYSIAITYLLYQTPFWRNIFIKNIAIWVIFVGTPIYFGAINHNLKENYFKKIVMDNLKLTVLMEFFASTFTFSLIVEIILVPLITLIFMHDTLSETKIQHKSAKNLLRILICIINIVFIYETALAAVEVYDDLDMTNTFAGSIIPIILSFFYIPASYLFAVVSKYQIIFIRMRFKEPNKDNIKIKILHRSKVIWTCRFSLSKLSKFEKSSVQGIYTSMSEMEFNEILLKFKSDFVPQGTLNRNYTQQERKIINQIKETEFRKRIEYISNHVGLFTIVATFIIGLTSIILKGLIYVFFCGKYDYWGISHTYINLADENILYDIILYAAASVIYITLNALPFVIITSEKKWYIKIFSILIVFLASAIILFIYFIVNEMNVESNFVLSWTLCRQLIFYSVALTIIAYIPGVTVAISNKISSKGVYDREPYFWYKNFNFYTIAIIVFGISVYIAFAYYYGGDTANNQNKFKIINNNYVVIYEDTDNFIVSECELKDNQVITIDRTTQKLIGKRNIRTELLTFDEVN